MSGFFCYLSPLATLGDKTIKNSTYFKGHDYSQFCSVPYKLTACIPLALNIPSSGSHHTVAVVGSLKGLYCCVCKICLMLAGLLSLSRRGCPATLPPPPFESESDPNQFDTDGTTATDGRSPVRSRSVGRSVRLKGAATEKHPLILAGNFKSRRNPKQFSWHAVCTFGEW